MKLRTHILWLCLVALIGVTTLAAVSLSTLKHTMLQERTGQVTTLVTLAKSSLDKLYEQEQAGKLTREQAQAEARRILGSLRHDQLYFWARGYANDVNYVHPDAKRIGTVDAKGGKEAGVRYRAALEGRETATLTAWGTKPGATEKVQKLYGVVWFKPWDWIVGTGDYIDDIDTAFWQSAKALLAIGGVLMLVIGLLGWTLARNLYRKLGGEPDYAALIAKKVASGDLTSSVALKPHDSSSLLFSLNEMQSQLAGIVSGIKLSASAVSSASGEIVMGNADLASRTEEQAAAIEQTASTMTQLTETVRQNVESAHQANILAKDADNIAGDSNAAVQQMVSTINDIRAGSTKISEITNIIEGIAFQTNILALNAAVEAARAGEQGRGFAVVAGEVRTLAQRSATAAKEIKDLIATSVSLIENGSAQATQVSGTIGNVKGAIKRVADIVSEIALASREQGEGIQQVSQAVNQIDAMTQHNSALVEQSAAAGQSLQDQATQLNTSVSTFQLPANGDEKPLQPMAAALTPVAA